MKTAIPVDNFAYAVLIKLDNGSGSGFRIRTKSDMYFVTAKHVLFSHENLISEKVILISQPKDMNDGTKQVMSIDLRQLNDSGLVFKHPIADVAAFHLGKIKEYTDRPEHSLEANKGVEVTEVAKTSVVTWNATNRVIFLSDVLISNDVFLTGYPSSLGLKRMPQFDYDKPLLRKGIVASINKVQGTIILDCPVYYGNSGGPVIQVTKVPTGTEYDIIGVISEFIPYTEQWVNQSNGIVHSEISNSGYSVAVAMDSVFDMLKINKPFPSSEVK